MIDGLFQYSQGFLSPMIHDCNYINSRIFLIRAQFGNGFSAVITTAKTEEQGVHKTGNGCLMLCLQKDLFMMLFMIHCTV